MNHSEAGSAVERRIILSYARGADRAAFSALLALDDRLGEIVAAARDPLIGQMRLTWWHDALCALDTALPPAEPTLRAVHADLLSRGVTRRSLAQLVDGWEALLAIDSAPEQALEGHAHDRGATLFDLASGLFGARDDRLAEAGRGWALADAAARTGQGIATARAHLSSLTDRRWPVALRPLSAMALAARIDLSDGAPAGSLSRTARLLRHRLTGR